MSKGLLLMSAMAIAACGCQKNCQTIPCEVVEENYIHAYGVEVPQQDWSRRGESGQVVSTLKSGVVVKKNFNRGVLDGECSYSFPHTENVERIEHYEKGDLRREVCFRPSGDMHKEVHYFSPSRKKISYYFDNHQPRCNEYFENDNLIEAEYYNLNQQVEGKIDQGFGKRVVRDNYGQLKSEDKFEDGQLVSRTYFYPNNAVKEIVPYSGGKINGKKHTFLQAGEPNTIEEWSNNQQEGVTVVFRNGEKYAEVPYVQGKKNGVEKRYRNENDVVEEISWFNGERHGPTNAYIGSTVTSDWYFNGNQVNKGTYDRLSNPVPR